MSNLSKESFDSYLKELFEGDYNEETHEKVKKIAELLANEIYEATAEMMALKQNELEIAIASRSSLDISRVELIDEEGRRYVNMEAENATLSLQDGGNTLKIFVSSKNTQG